MTNSFDLEDEAADPPALARGRLLQLHAPPRGLRRLPALPPPPPPCGVLSPRRCGEDPPLLRGGAGGARADLRRRRDGALRRVRRAPQPPRLREAPQRIGAGIRLRTERSSPAAVPRLRLRACSRRAPSWTRRA